MNGSVLLGLLSTLLFGLRHGIDYDHIAAITDLSASAAGRRESMKLGLLYTAGHGMVVLTLGVAAVGLGASLPPSVDVVMERLVGATLVGLGAYVLWTLVRTPRESFRMTARYCPASHRWPNSKGNILRAC